MTDDKQYESWFSGEVSYDTERGWIHSDIGCRREVGETDTTISDELRAFYHSCLDEWLDKSGGTGGFWLGDPSYFIGWGG